MPDQLAQFKANTPTKIVLLITVLISMIVSWMVVRWYMGNTIAEYFVTEHARIEVAHRAAAWAPADPLPQWRLGNVIQKELPPDQITAAVEAYEKAVSLSPNDYRFWMELGAAQEQAGQSEKAEKSLREAVRLAPAYAQPRWHLGNLLLRSDRYDEGFLELQRASEANPEFLSQLFNLAWQVYKDDFDQLKQAAGQGPGARAGFSQYLLARGRFEEGLRLWNTLSESEKRTHRPAAEGINKYLIGSGLFHKAMDVWNDVAPAPNYRAELGRMLEPGFEENVSHSGNPFGWQEPPKITGVEIGVTPVLGHSGNRSLRMRFHVNSALPALTLAQVVPVEPNTNYDFEFYVKTESLITAGTPYVVIVDGNNQATLATSPPAPNGNNNWQRVAMSFKTTANTQAIRVTINRTPCQENPICPIFGVIWYDDFALKARK